MRRMILEWLGKGVKQHPQDAVCQHKYLKQNQKGTKLISYSRDYCGSCEEFMCNICSEVHIRQHCDLTLATNRNMGTNILKEFNQGHLMQVNLDGLSCICGTPLTSDNINHAICSACGLASCSIECHQEWQKMGKCTYHDNYFFKPKDINMRSIVFRNIANIRKAKIKNWSIANRTALNYISCYVSSQHPYVYMQRGYRNYGQPQTQLLSRMIKMPFGLDFTTHIERVCTCQCQTCQIKKHHSFGNCEFSCDQDYLIKGGKLSYTVQQHFECDCSCQFCRSGIVIERHTKMQCLLYCKKRAPFVN